MEESVTGEMEMFNLLKTMEIFANTIFYLQTNESLSLGNWKYQLKKNDAQIFEHTSLLANKEELITGVPSY